MLGRGSPESVPVGGDVGKTDFAAILRDRELPGIAARRVGREDHDDLLLRLPRREFVRQAGALQRLADAAGHTAIEHDHRDVLGIGHRKAAGKVLVPLSKHNRPRRGVNDVLGDAKPVAMQGHRHHSSGKKPMPHPSKSANRHVKPPIPPSSNPPTLRPPAQPQMPSDRRCRRPCPPACRPT